MHLIQPKKPAPKISSAVLSIKQPASTYECAEASRRLSAAWPHNALARKVRVKYNVNRDLILFELHHLNKTRQNPYIWRIDGIKSQLARNMPCLPFPIQYTCLSIFLSNPDRPSSSMTCDWNQTDERHSDLPISHWSACSTVRLTT